jgi:hypothetical protein
LTAGIEEFFSNQVITPDVTTADDVQWWYREHLARLGLQAWFRPSFLPMIPFTDRSLSCPTDPMNMRTTASGLRENCSALR